MSEYDILVLGAGPGGYVAALRAAQLGKKTGLIERGSLGGVCLNVGCIPSKTLIHGADLYEKISKAKDFGITVEGQRLDFAKLMARKDRVVKRLTAGVAYLCRTKGVDVIKGTGRLTSANTIEVSSPEGDQTSLTAGKIILATGSEPAAIPGFEIDEDRVLSSTGVLGLRELPESLIVLGGGYIGVELGTVYAKLGTEVRIVELLNQILPGMDADLTEPVVKKLRKLKVRVLTGAKATGLERSADSVCLNIDSEGRQSSIEAQRILVSVGRRPVTRDIGLETAGIETDENGLIVVDGQRRTKIENVYAIGDITPGPQLAHKASHEGIVAAESAAGLQSVFDPAGIPAVVFTDPEIATVGLTEEEAKREGIEFTIGRFPYSACGRAMTLNEPDGFVKILADKETGKLLGVNMVGVQASDLISEASLALQTGSTLEQLAETIHPHPTLSETLMEAALAALDKPIHI